jgi:hypothetical protein
MRDLGITRVFNLRSDTEIEKFRAPPPVIEGVEVFRTPIFRKDDHSPEMMAKYVCARYSLCMITDQTRNIQVIPTLCQWTD